MATSLHILRLIAPQYATISDGDAQAWIDLAASSVANADLWGAVYPEALANLAAHLMTRAGVGTSPAAGDAASTIGGSITSLRTGDLAVSYGGTGGAGAGRSSDGSDDDYTTTKYGLRFIALRQSRAARAPRWVR